MRTTKRGKRGSATLRIDSCQRRTRESIWRTVVERKDGAASVQSASEMIAWWERMEDFGYSLRRGGWKLRDFWVEDYDSTSGPATQSYWIASSRTFRRISCWPPH